MGNILRLLAIIALGWLAGGCATLGENFPDDVAASIVIGQTTRTDIEKKIGAPFRTGVDSGNPTATYLYYRLGLFVSPITKDLTVTYSPQGIVKAYVFNSNLDQEKPNGGDADYNAR